MSLVFIKIADNLSDNEHRETARQMVLSGIDGIELSIVGGRWGPTWDNRDYSLDFLRMYKGIRALRIDLPKLTDISSITHLKEELQHLHLGEIKSKKVSLGTIQELSCLKSLSVARNLKKLEVITKLQNLEELSMTGYQIEKLDYIGMLPQLKKLHIGFGTSTNIKNLNQLKSLEELSILWIKGLSDINAISELTSLQKLKIENEKQIKSLPDISKLKNLKNIRLMNLSKLEDLTNIDNSFAEEFIVVGPNRNIDIILPLIKAKNIKRVYTYFYNTKDQERAESILGDKFSTTGMQYEMDHIKSLPIKYLDIKTGTIIK